MPELLASLLFRMAPNRRSLELSANYRGQLLQAQTVIHLECTGRTTRPQTLMRSRAKRDDVRKAAWVSGLLNILVIFLAMESRRCIGGSPSSADAVAMLTRRLQHTAQATSSCRRQRENKDRRRLQRGQLPTFLGVDL